MPRTVRDPLARVCERPLPEQWDADEAMTIIEAVAVFFPPGPVGLSTIRLGAAGGQLAVASVPGKILTTPRAIKQWVRPCLAKEDASVNRPGSGSAPTTEPGSSLTGNTTSARDAAAMILTRRKKRS